MTNGIWLAAMGLTGLLAGSLMNVVVYRLPLMIRNPQTALSLWLPASHCPHCQHPVRWRDNIPLLSWLCLQGRCRDCQHTISKSYPATEAGVMLVFSLIALFFTPGLTAVGIAIFFWFGCAMSLIDLRHFLLPDLLTLPLLWLGLLLHCLSAPEELSNVIFGAVTGYLILWIMNQLCRLVLKREGLGYGDCKLLAACGAWTGWQSLSLQLLVASTLGIVFALLCSRGKGLKGKEIPFGPPLAIAGFILLIQEHYW